MTGRAYADWKYYKNTYLKGRDPIIQRKDFPFWSTEASGQIDVVTGNKLWDFVDDEIPEVVRRTVCTVVEMLFRNQQALEMISGAGMLIIPQGISAKIPQEVKSAEEMQAQIDAAIKSMLAHSGLLFRGAR